MSLLDRYVAAVKRHLPTEMRDDVSRELRSTLADSLDALELDTGKPLSETQIAGVLKRRGHPLQVAASYRGERTLISARAFPVYVRTLTVAIVLVASAVLAELMFGSGGVPGLDQIWRGLHTLYWAFLLLFTWITIIFHFFDGWMARASWMEKWEPSRLRPVPNREFPIPVFGTIADVVISVLLFSLVVGGMTIAGKWFHVSAPVQIDVGFASSNLWTSATAAAVALVIALRMFSFIDRFWSRGKLLPTITGHLVIGTGLAVLALQAGGLSITSGAEALVEEHASSVLWTLRLFMLMAAARSIFLAVQGVIMFRQLSWPNERPFQN